MNEKTNNYGGMGRLLYLWQNVKQLLFSNLTANIL